MSETSIETTINEVLTRGVASFIDPNGVFKAKLLKKAEGKYPNDIIVKFGVDPTRPDIHLGHAVIFRKLRALQELGCKIVFVIGDFTTSIGDPTGKNKARPEIDRAAIEANMKTYIEQAGKILRTEPEVFSWITNSDWFTSITDLNLPADYNVGFQVTHDGIEITTPVDPNSVVGKAIVFEKTRMQVKMQQYALRKQISVITLGAFFWTLRHITHAQLIKRDMFQGRLAKGEDLYMHEMLYPVLQGIDSSVINVVYGSCDLEIGGTDQTFNMLMGRQIQEINAHAYTNIGANTDLQAVAALSLLVGTDGTEKMSKSLDNYIAVTDEPNNMYGKVMSIPDTAIVQYFTLCTYTPATELTAIAHDLEKGKKNPRNIKMRLAREIVAIYHGEESSKSAEDSFVNTFKKGTMPTDAPEVVAKEGDKLVDVLLTAKLIPSKSEFRRLLREGAIAEIDGDTKITDPEQTITKALNLRVGKKRFLKIKI